MSASPVWVTPSKSYAQFFFGRLVVTNMWRDASAWTTAYSKAGGILLAGCVPAPRTVTFNHDTFGREETRPFLHNAFQGSTYQIRAEVMAGPVCRGAKLCDTRAPVDTARTRGHPSTVYMCFIDWKRGGARLRYDVAFAEPRSMPVEPVDNLTFETALEELERLLARMEDGKLPLEESLAAYQRGAELIRFCESRLGEAQARIAILEGDTLRDLNPGGQ